MEVGWGAPPTNNFEVLNSDPTKLSETPTNYQRLWFILDIGKIFWYRDFMKNFHEMLFNDYLKKFEL